MRRAVSRSMPLAADTHRVSGARKGAAFLAVSRTAKDGAAITATSLSPSASRLSVSSSSSGRATPGSRGLTRSRRSSSHRWALWDHSVTLCPLSVSSSARAVPQPPLPSTVMRISKDLPIRHAVFKKMYHVLKR